MPKLLLNNWPAKLISLVIALIIWAYVKNIVQPDFLDQLVNGAVGSGR